MKAIRASWTGGYSLYCEIIVAEILTMNFPIMICGNDFTAACVVVSENKYIILKLFSY